MKQHSFELDVLTLRTIGDLIPMTEPDRQTLHTFNRCTGVKRDYLGHRMVLITTHQLHQLCSVMFYAYLHTDNTSVNKHIVHNNHNVHNVTQLSTSIW